MLTDVKKELCDGVPYEFSSYSCRACESAQHERENQLLEKIGKLEAENKRLREALEHAVTTDTTVDKYGIWRIDEKTFQTWAADILKGSAE